MDDELEDEVIYQTLLTHLKLLSKFSIYLPTTSSSLAIISRHMRFYLLRPETIACGLVLVALLAFFNSVEKWCKPLVDNVARIADELRLHCGRCVKLGTGSRCCDETTPSCGGADGGKTSWELRRPNVGVYAMKGRRPNMEDRFDVFLEESRQESCSKSTAVALYGVFDGHGGDFAADYVERNLFKNILAHLNGTLQTKSAASQSASDEWNMSELLTEDILAVDRQLLEVAKASKELSGTTLLVALVHGTKLFVANVGDSRGVICDSKGLTIPLSFDHKPQQLKEQKRIKQAGGFVTFNGVWRVAGILATSRALGDYPLKDRNLIIADPDVLMFSIDDLRPRFMILATDGLWDTFSNEEAVTFIKGRLHEVDHGAKSLTLQAHQRGSLDNITVVVVTFPQDGARLP